MPPTSTRRRSLLGRPPTRASCDYIIAHGLLSRRPWDSKQVRCHFPVLIRRHSGSMPTRPPIYIGFGPDHDNMA